MTEAQLRDSVDDPSAYQHRFAHVNGIRVHYVEEGAGPLVILLHGFPFLWYLWRNQIGPLAAAGHRVVVPDLRGFGQTDGPPAKDMTELVGDVVGLMRSLDRIGVGEGLQPAARNGDGLPQVVRRHGGGAVQDEGSEAGVRRGVGPSRRRGGALAPRLAPLLELAAD